MLRLFSTLVAIAVFAAACTGTQPSGAASEDEPPDGSPGTSAGPSGEGELPGVNRFTVVSGSFDLAELPLLGALDVMRENGYSIDYVQVAGTDIAIDGINRGQFQFAADAVNPWMNAIQQGVPAKMILQRRFNDWGLMSVTDITSCDELDGRTVAIHSEVSLTTAMTRQWVEENCPEAEPEYVIIEGSENRLAAMIAGEVEASPLELVDRLNLEEEAAGEFHELTNFAQSLPQLSSNVQVVNSDFAEENPGTVQAFVEALLEQHRLIAEDPNHLLELAESYPTMVTEQPGQEVLEAYSTLFPVNGGLTDEILDFSLHFFTDVTGLLEPGLTAEDVADLSYIERALEKMGEAEQPTPAS